MAVGSQIANIGVFKFGDSVRDHHTHIYKYEILADIFFSTIILACTEDA